MSGAAAGAATQGTAIAGALSAGAKVLLSGAAVDVGGHMMSAPANSTDGPAESRNGARISGLAGVFGRRRRRNPPSKEPGKSLKVDFTPLFGSKKE